MFIYCIVLVVCFILKGRVNVIGFAEYLIEYNRYMSLVGIAAVIAIAFLCSNNRKKISPRLVITTLFMQCFLALFILHSPIGQMLFKNLAAGFEALYGFAESGARFVFGNLTQASGAWGFIFAIKVVPIIIFFGALLSLLYHCGIVQFFVRFLAFVIRPLLGTSGAETLSVTANSVLGQTEAPLLIKNYLPAMTNSEMFVVMVSGMAHLSGAILAVYGSMGIPIVHLLSSSVMAIPGSFLVAKMLVPETEIPETMSSHLKTGTRDTSNILDALFKGTVDGVKLAVNIIAMLIAFISLIALADYILAATTGFFLAEGLTLNVILGKLFYGVAWLIGIPLQDCATAGSLLGQKFVINEFVAYTSLAHAHVLDRTHILMTYALAGFANFSSIGIQIGGIGAICPSKQQTLTQLGMRALLGGTLANLLNAAIVGLFI